MTSPSPEYPQEIVNTGDDGTVDLTVTGMNQESQFFPIPTPNGLPGIPVDSGGNYTDENGQEWVCDYVDFARGVKVQNIADLVITGDMLEQFVESSSYGNYARIIESRIKQTDSSSRMLMCDKFVGVSFANRIGNPDTYRIFQETSGGVSYIALRWPLSNNADFETMKAELNVNPVHAIFILAAPITTPLDADTIAAYRELTSYDGGTNIFSDEDVGIEAELVTEKIDKDGYADPSAELSLYYSALAGFTSFQSLPMPSCRESALVRKLLDPSYEVNFTVNELSSRNEKYLWDLINGTTEMLANVPKSNSEKYLHVMLGGEVKEYPTISSELDYWMDICANFYGKI